MLNGSHENGVYKKSSKTYRAIADSFIGSGSICLVEGVAGVNFINSP